jgi:predicted nucleic acid-binding protein
VPNQITHFVRKPRTQSRNLSGKSRPSFLCPQNIAEFWNVATRPAELNGLGLSHEEVLDEVSSIESLLTLLPDVPAIYATWKQIVKDHRVQGVKVYDARLVATMTVYAVDSVLTFNAADFKRYSNVTALHPSSMVT